MKQTLYLKVEQCIELVKSDVTIGDVAKLACTDVTVVNRLKVEKLFSVKKRNNQKCVVSVLMVIQRILQIYPGIEIQNLGESDFIVSFPKVNSSKIMEYFKVAGVCIISFFGAVFAMMTFNEDVSALDSFRKVYTWVIGSAPQGATILEAGYSAGVSAGIILFFNHFGKKRLTKEPSPVEVEMTGYDKQVYDTLIQQAGRNGKERDVE